MSLKDNLSRLSPNEFLEKMQNMFQMYQESQEDYYEEAGGASAGACLNAGISLISSIKYEDRRDLRSEKTEKFMLDTGSLPSSVGAKLSQGLELVFQGLKKIVEDGNKKKSNLIDGYIGSVGIKKYLRQ